MISSILPASPNVRLIPVDPAPLDESEIEAALGDLSDLSVLIDRLLADSERGELQPWQVIKVIQQASWICEIYS